MNLSKKYIYIIILAIIIATVIPITSVGMWLLLNNANNDPNRVEITLVQTSTGMSMSCIMIEANGRRIYIDAYALPSDYSEKPADAIFITHPHDDHYHPESIDLIAQDSTEFIGPASCDDFITLYNGFGVIPGDSGTVAGFQYEAIPAYTTGHLEENKWCGYIITVNGIRILHAGDSAVIPEYNSLAGTIDVACLPVGQACSNMGPEGAKEVIEIIQPEYVIPYHHGYQDLTDFKSEVETMYPSTRVHLNSDYFSSDPLIVVA